MSDEQVAVGSTVYNLAGNEDNRLDFLQSLVLGAVLQGADSMGSVIASGYRNSPAVRFRNFVRWAKQDPEFLAALGITSGTVQVRPVPDYNTVKNNIPLGAGQTAQVEFAKIDEADLDYWVLRYLTAAYPGGSPHGTYVYRYDSNAGNLVITYSDETIEVVPVTDYFNGPQYLYARYTPIQDETWLPEAYFIYRQGTGIPALDELFVQGNSTELGSFYPPIPFRYEGKTISGGPGRWYVKLRADWDHEKQELWIAPAADQADKKVRAEWIDTNPDHRYAYVIKSWSGDNKLYNALTSSAPVFKLKNREIGWESEWLPFAAAPEVNDDDGSSPATVAIYPACKKAFKRAFNGDFDQVQDSILENASIGDIDYAYAVFAVSLNVKENACRKYVYKFFQHLGQSAPVSPVDEADWWGHWNEADNGNENYPHYPWQTLQIESVHDGISNYRTDIRWAFMTEEIGQGLLKADAKPGELWFEVAPDPLSDLPHTIDAAVLTEFRYFNQQIVLCWQETRDFWRRLKITGLHHKNLIYKSNAVRTTAKEALESIEESAFLVPLHEEIYRSLSMVDATQMATACTFLVFNCYETRKKKWYQEDWFKIIVIAVIVIVSVVLAVWTGGSSLGLLGSAGSVGTALGFSGTTAIIIGAAVNTLAGMALCYLITQGSIQLFGEKWGLLIGGIVSAIATMGLAAGSIPGLLDSLTRADTWISLSMATGNATAQFLQASAQEIAESTKEMLEKMKKESDRVQELVEKNLEGDKKIDLNLITQYISEFTEKPEQFLSRTLMTGSDIVELTLDAIGNFADQQLRVELP